MEQINNVMTKVSEKSDILSQFKYERDIYIKEKVQALEACDFICQELIENRRFLFDEGKEVSINVQQIPEYTENLEYRILGEFTRMQEDINVQWVPEQSAFKFLVK